MLCPKRPTSLGARSLRFDHYYLNCLTSSIVIVSRFQLETERQLDSIAATSDDHGVLVSIAATKNNSSLLSKRGRRQNSNNDTLETPRLDSLQPASNMPIPNRNTTFVLSGCRVGALAVLLLLLSHHSQGFQTSTATSTTAFVVIGDDTTTPRKPWNAHVRNSPAVRMLSLSLSSSSSSSSSSSTEESAQVVDKNEEQQAIAANLAVLRRAADTKDADPEQVCEALANLEKQMRRISKEDPSIALTTRDALNGDWRLIFTTGTGETQKKYGKINYFPLKAVQSFRTIDRDPMTIENGIYVGDFPLIKFFGKMEFDLRKRRLEFDFDRVLVLSIFDVALGKGDAAKLGSKSGLGSDSNVDNAAKGRNAFFNWISADDSIATARGAGGGLALWKRIPTEQG